MVTGIKWMRKMERRRRRKGEEGCVTEMDRGRTAQPCPAQEQQQQQQQQQQQEQSKHGAVN